MRIPLSLLLTLVACTSCAADPAAVEPARAVTAGSGGSAGGGAPLSGNGGITLEPGGLARRTSTSTESFHQR